MAPVQNENDRSLEHTVLRSLRDRSFSHVSGVASLNHRLIAAIPPGVRPNARDFA